MKALRIALISCLLLSLAACDMQTGDFYDDIYNGVIDPILGNFYRTWLHPFATMVHTTVLNNADQLGTSIGQALGMAMSMPEILWGSINGNGLIMFYLLVLAIVIVTLVIRVGKWFWQQKDEIFKNIKLYLILGAVILIISVIRGCSTGGT